MELMAGPLDAIDVRRRVARGRRLVIPVAEPVDMSDLMAAGQALRARLPLDMHVIASPPTAERGPSLTVLQLVTDTEAMALRPALEHLVVEFRRLAAALVDQLPGGAAVLGGAGRDCPETIRWQDTTWCVHLHGEHCRFEDLATGVVVEVDLHDPATVDAYFLLVYAETSGRHRALVDACVEGFHDMCRLLDLAGIV
jgi:hypothetical protein